MSAPKLPKRTQDLVDAVNSLDIRAADAERKVTVALEALKAAETKWETRVATDQAALDTREAKLDLREEKLKGEQARARADGEREAEQIRKTTLAWKHEVEAQVSVEEATARALIEDKVAGFQFVGMAWGDFQRALAAQQAEALEAKARPALKAADAVRAKGKELAEATRRANAAEWTVALYEYYLPWITELLDQREQQSYVNEGGDEGEVRQRNEDPASQWLSKEEWVALPEGERNQRALDRYLHSRKSPWQLGRDYERYIGYLREQDGCAVTYQGIAKGFEDLGRDVLAERDGTIEVIQCKRWARSKTIHEKHVFQLYGTTVLARLENPDKTVAGTFTTTTKLSEKAREVAEYLDIKVEEGLPLDDYPRIKCNLARRGEERIYHLPFDQQYDTTVVEPDRGERYVATVAEAEDRGFRRAWRWRQSN